MKYLFRKNFTLADVLIGVPIATVLVIQNLYVALVGWVIFWAIISILFESK